jgi:hypothetical protein
MKLPKGAVRNNPPKMSGFVDRNKGQAIDDEFAISSQKALKPGRGPLPKGAVRNSEKPILNQFLENVGNSTGNYIKDMTSIIHSPKQTVEGLRNVINGVGYKTGLFPEHKDAEPYADAAGQYYKDRWGGIDNIGNTLWEDPVGGVADFAGLLTLGGAAPGMAKIGKAGRVIDPANLMAKGVGKGIGELTKGLSTKLHTGAVKPSTPKNMRRRANILQQMKDDKLKLNQGGIDKLQQKLDISQAKQQALIDPHADVTVPSAPIFDKAQAYLNKLFGDPAVDWKIVEGAQAELDKFREQMFYTNGSEISLPELQKYKVTHSKNTVYDAAEGKHSAGNIGLKVRNLMANSAKKTLEKKIPGLEKVNKKYKLRMDARQTLESAANRVAKHKLLSLSSAMLGAAGVATGGSGGDIVGGITGGLTGLGVGLINHPATAVNTAIGLNNMRRLPMDPGIPLSALSQGLLQSGRLASEE